MLGFCFLGGYKLRPHFLDPGFLAGKAPEVEDSCPSHLSFFVHLYFLEGRHVDREDPFNTYGSRHFSNGKGLRSTLPSSLDHYTPEELGPGLLTFLDLVVNSYGVTCGEFGKIFFWNKFVLNKFY